MRAAKLTTALQSQDKHNFWCEMKLINNNHSSLPNVVDDAHGDKDITNTFTNKCKHLYNSVSYDVNDMNVVTNEFENSIAISCKTGACKASHTVNVDDVTNAVLRLKPHKADGIENVSSDALINGYFELYVHLALFFNAMILHGVSPSNMLLTLVPIPKNRKKSLNDNNNYRAIALGSIVCKVIDNIILENHKYVWRSSGIQYVFKVNILLLIVPLFFMK